MISPAFLATVSVPRFFAQFEVPRSSKDNRPYYFSPEERLLACYHEAAHAIIFSLGDILVKAVSVHPVGAKENCDAYDGYGACFIEEGGYIEDLNSTMARAFVCGVMAGHVSQSMFAGEWCKTYSISDAEITTRVLEVLPGGQSEGDHLIDETMRALGVFWDRVSKLARHLENKGHVDFKKDLKACKLLPKPFIGIKSWPRIPKKAI